MPIDQGQPVHPRKEAARLVRSEASVTDALAGSDLYATQAGFDAAFNEAYLSQSDFEAKRARARLAGEEWDEATEESSLITRVAHAVTAGFKVEWQGTLWMWLPSSADDPRGSHMAFYGGVFSPDGAESFVDERGVEYPLLIPTSDDTGEVIAPGDEPGCQCGYLALTPAEAASAL